MNWRGFIAVLLVAASLTFIGYGLLGIRAELDDGTDAARDRATTAASRACIAEQRARVEAGDPAASFGDLPQC